MLPADAVAPRLDHLLRRARIVKQVASIDPPLQVSELVPEGEPLLGEIEGGKEVRTLAVESAAKSVFYANLVSRCPSSRPSAATAAYMSRGPLVSRSRRL